MELKKNWWQSKAIWMALFAFVDIVVLGIREMGGEVPNEITQAQASREQIISTIQLILAAFSSALAAYFRKTATKEIK